MNAAQPDCDFVHFVPPRLAFVPPYLMLSALRRGGRAADDSRRHHETLLATLILCASLPVFAADKANADVLNRSLGSTWPLEGKMLDTDYSKATTVTGVSTCGWSPDHIFMLCD